MQMKKLIIITNWAHPIEKTWSGTSYSLVSSLKSFFEVEIKNLNLVFFQIYCVKQVVCP